ncbi:MAG: helix-turn-helix domain-containing protein [Candidatus Zapsychrus exili]|nr:helix-turn-helix domain-containing protein [Candidatus Zapsychrus exili]
MKLNEERLNLLTRKEAATFLGVTKGTLAVWACTHRYDLPYIKVGRLVRYRYSDILQFLEKRTKLKSKDNGGANE